MAQIKKQILFILISCVSIPSIGFARKNECKKLIDELNSMKKAQYEIIKSLAANHAAMADSDEEISDLLAVAPPDTAEEIAAKLKSTGKAFRTRGLQAMKTANELDKATSDIVRKAAACL